jgi:hypothetical protein
MKMNWVLILCLVLGIACIGCMKSQKLPMNIQVVESGTQQPITNAVVELQWRCGFQGYYWGKPVTKHTDTVGLVVFAVNDVPPVSEDGYSLGSRITKLFISTLIVTADGYEDVVLSYPTNVTMIVLSKKPKGS